MLTLTNYIDSYEEYYNHKVPIYNQKAFDLLQKAGLLAYQTLEYIKPFIKEGVSTDYLDNLCHEFILKNHATPAPLNYKGFPKATCISVNHVICHGIPNEKKLANKDILNVDITVILNGFYGDTSAMFSVGEPGVKAKNLINTTYTALLEAIKIVKPGIYLWQIGEVIENIAHNAGFSVVEDFCGHGIGHAFHQPPEILHFKRMSSNLILKEGMVFTIEPMINAGQKYGKILQNGWTAVTKDKSLSAQFEHTIGVLNDGCRIFTHPQL